MVQMKKKIRTIISKQEEDMTCEFKKKKTYLNYVLFVVSYNS